MSSTLAPITHLRQPHCWQYLPAAITLMAGSKTELGASVETLAHRQCEPCSVNARGVSTGIFDETGVCGEAGHTVDQPQTLRSRGVQDRELVRRRTDSRDISLRSQALRA